MSRGRPPYRRQQVLAVIKAAALLGQMPTYRAIARDAGIEDWRNAKAICRSLAWPWNNFTSNDF